VILLLNGAFGIGKTTVARALVARLRRAVLFDPEMIGIPLQRITRVDDFQKLRLWRRLTIAGLRITRMLHPNVVVPMAFSNAAYLDEIRDGIRRFEPRVHHFCLTAPLEVVRGRLSSRRSKDMTWQFRRAAECCAVHTEERFARQVRTDGRPVEEIAQEILGAIETD
jgi:predicted kinase